MSNAGVPLLPNSKFEIRKSEIPAPYDIIPHAYDT
jgi:hypothetical protein